ncbi:aldehyde dehydrogenase family protein [Agrobacterium salinitolerans]|uniref:aldehyde dehydrogenase family protein n=1 Tax=Agrobacterium salinitolerans TaxID=1183413 RepID=UPI0015746809|nr:aldehyde dehydrogenase family protein [Agrobacterium salinitolerans]NTA40262.1 aldehyde dehydrogenase family protein [Agrobacterium salinitolerans]
MNSHVQLARLPEDLVLPTKRGLYYGGKWHTGTGEEIEIFSPGTGQSLGKVMQASVADVDAAVAAAALAFREWRRVKPMERAKILRRVAEILRANSRELAFIDSAATGNPVREMMYDASVAAMGMEFYAGLVTEMKGSTVPMGPDMLNYSIRQPYGVVGKIIPFNHPIMFCGYRAAAPLAAGNTVVIKPPDQAPLSALRFAELIDGLFPDGVVNIVAGTRDAGARLAEHPDVAKVALIGSVPAGRAVMKAASATVKSVMLELGGKNALIGFPDADPKEVAAGLVGGMNFTWCGQSCGSMSRAFIHDAIYDEVVAHVKELCDALKPGNPTDMETDMGAIVSKAQFDKIMNYIEIGKSEGGRLLCGGKRPDDPSLDNGYYILPTVFVDMDPTMTIAREEIFGPVTSIFRWSDYDRMMADVNSVEYGLTCSIWTRNLDIAHRAAADVDAGFVWINQASMHFPGVSFGGVKQSGIGREEGIEELFAYSQEKSVTLKLKS